MLQDMRWRSTGEERETNMQILHMCPANMATGGTEGIHNLVHYLSKCGADAKVWYVGRDLSNPQPKEYEKYACDYVTEMPKGFKGCVIFPEVWGNSVILPEYSECVVAINWQGVDVYNWHNPENKRGLFLQRKDTIHIANSDYAVDYLRNLGLHPIKISDCLNDDYFQDFSEEFSRDDKVLYNPTSAKMTQFQETVMARCTTELGIRFKALEGYSRPQLIDLFRRSKLYIDFGVFSGRERLPREAVMCGCCILTSNKGTASYFWDNSIPESYKIENIDDAVAKIKKILGNYDLCKPDFDEYRHLLRQDKNNYFNEVERLYNAILNHNTGT